MGSFGNLFSKKLDTAAVEELVDALIMGDVAPGIAAEIAAKVKQSDNPKSVLKKVLADHARKLEGGSINGRAILIVGANGAGKTTTIGKLAKKFADAGRSVVIGACDTFRAAADEQLDVWGNRAGARIVHGLEPAAVAYKTIESMGPDDVALLDTAGRLHNRTDLMDELSKIARVIKKIDASLPSDVWLVLDGNTGQNALSQIEYFNRAVPLTGLVVTKMDGTSRGGFLASYALLEKNPLPVAYIGYGEKIGDLKPFDADEYAGKLTDRTH